MDAGPVDPVAQTSTLEYFGLVSLGRVWVCRSRLHTMTWSPFGVWRDMNVILCLMSAKLAQPTSHKTHVSTLSLQTVFCLL